MRFSPKVEMKKEDIFSRCLEKIRLFDERIYRVLKSKKIRVREVSFSDRGKYISWHLGHADVFDGKVIITIVKDLPNFLLSLLAHLYQKCCINFFGKYSSFPF